MTALINFIDRLTRLGGWASALCILLMTALILVETTVRVAAERSIFVAEEYSAYLMANFVMLGLAHTLKERGHIRVNLLLSRLSGTPARWLRLLACGLGVLVFGLMTWELGVLCLDSLTSGAQSMNVTKTPIYLPQAGLALGAGLMTLQMAAQALRLLGGDQEPEEEG